MFNNEKVGAVIVAAGRGERMGSVDKMFAPLGGKVVLARVIDVFQECRSIDQIVIVLGKQNVEAGLKLVAEEGWSRVTDVYPGGVRRQDSVRAGLERLNDCQWVVVHDGARPLVTVDLIESGLKAAKETGAAVCAVPVSDTVKMVGCDGFVRETPPRQSLRAVQTPQVFRCDILEKAYHQVRVEVTDDASLVEELGCRVKLYAGSCDNIKITMPEDLALARILWRQRGG